LIPDLPLFSLSIYCRVARRPKIRPQNLQGAEIIGNVLCIFGPIYKMKDSVFM
jgi:hypothetical protein